MTHTTFEIVLLLTVIYLLLLLNIALFSAKVTFSVARGSLLWD